MFSIVPRLLIITLFTAFICSACDKDRRFSDNGDASADSSADVVLDSGDSGSDAAPPPSCDELSGATACNAQMGCRYCYGQSQCLERTADCPTERLVFATSRLYPGNFGGISFADAECAELANNAGLFTGTYLAWLSTSSTDPATRFTQSTVPYVLVDGTQVAASWTQFVNDQTIDNAISLTEAGEAPPTTTALPACAGSNKVWTGTNWDGTAMASTCSDWSDVSSTQGLTGRYISTSLGHWSAQCETLPCAGEAVLYCFQQ